MLNWNPLWPAASGDRHGNPATPAGNGALWSPTSILEFQAYFWSQLIDANRNFWSMCAAAFPGLPAAAAAAVKPEVTETAMEPAAATHAVEDLESVLESQTRFWNHMLDANRNLWSGVSWNMPEAFAETTAAVEAAAPRRAPSPAKRSQPAARKRAPAKAKTQRKH